MWSLNIAFWLFLHGPVMHHHVAPNTNGGQALATNPANPVATETKPTTSSSARAKPTRTKPVAKQPKPAELTSTTSVSIALPVAVQGALTADQVVDKVQRFYLNTKTMQRQFRQTVTNATFGT